MAAVRNATVTWNGDLQTGSGTVTAATSGAFADLPVTWAARTEEADGRTSPEELLAAAHASCFSMQFSSILAKGGTPPEHLHVSATVTFDRVDQAWTVVSSVLDVVGVVPGMSSEAFDAAAENAKETCPISRALKGNVEMTVHATLEE
jgi:osmotically inducible protein OsmC